MTPYYYYDFSYVQCQRAQVTSYLVATIHIVPKISKYACFPIDFLHSFVTRGSSLTHTPPSGTAKSPRYSLSYTALIVSLSRSLSLSLSLSLSIHTHTYIYIYIYIYIYMLMPQKRRQYGLRFHHGVLLSSIYSATSDCNVWVGKASYAFDIRRTVHRDIFL